LRHARERRRIRAARPRSRPGAPQPAGLPGAPQPAGLPGAPRRQRAICAGRYDSPLVLPNFRPGPRRHRCGGRQHHGTRQGAGIPV